MVERLLEDLGSRILRLGKIDFLGEEIDLLQDIRVPAEDYILQFMEILEILEQNYGDPDFKLGQVSEQIYNDKDKERSIQRILNKANTKFTDLLPCIQMKKAIEFLQQGLGSRIISEQVGFKTEEYFSSVFRKTFNMSPSDYKMKFLQMQIERRLEPAKGLAQKMRDKINMILSSGKINFLGKEINLLPNFSLKTNSNLTQWIELLNMGQWNLRG